MTRYEELMSKSNFALEKAHEFRKKNEPDLANFFNNASKGYEKQAKNLSYEEAIRIVHPKEVKHGVRI